MCKWHNGGIPVALPRTHPCYEPDKTICIDLCITPVIRRLWESGVETLGSCCGHEKTGPSLIVADHYDAEKLKDIADHLKELDPEHTWELLQWQLTHVNKEDDKDGD